MKKTLIIIAILIVLGGIYFVSKGNFCLFKVNGNCVGGSNNGDRTVLQVPIRSGDTQEDVANRIKDSIPKAGNEFVTLQFVKPNQVFKSGSYINGQVLSKDWITTNDSLGTFEIRDTNNKLVLGGQLHWMTNASISNGQYQPGNGEGATLPYKFDELATFLIPSTQQGKIILYDVNKNTKGPSRALEVPITFF